MIVVMETTKQLTSGNKLPYTDDATEISDLIEPSAKLIVLTP